MAAKKAAPKKSGASDKAKKAQSARMTKQAKAAPKSGAGYIAQFKGNVSDNAGKVGAKNPTGPYAKEGEAYGTGRTMKRGTDQTNRAIAKRNERYLPSQNMPAPVKRQQLEGRNRSYKKSVKEVGKFYKRQER